MLFDCFCKSSYADCFAEYVECSLMLQVLWVPLSFGLTTVCALYSVFAFLWTSSLRQINKINFTAIGGGLAMPVKEARREVSCKS